MNTENISSSFVCQQDNCMNMFCDTKGRTQGRRVMSPTEVHFQKSPRNDNNNSALKWDVSLWPFDPLI